MLFFGFDRVGTEAFAVGVVNVLAAFDAVFWPLGAVLFGAVLEE